MYTDVFVFDLIIFLFCGFISLFLCEMKKTDAAKTLMRFVFVAIVFSIISIGFDYVFLRQCLVFTINFFKRKTYFIYVFLFNK